MPAPPPRPPRPSAGASSGVVPASPPAPAGGGGSAPTGGPPAPAPRPPRPPAGAPAPRPPPPAPSGGSMRRSHVARFTPASRGWLRKVRTTLPDLSAIVIVGAGVAADLRKYEIIAPLGGFWPTHCLLPRLPSRLH